MESECSTIGRLITTVTVAGFGCSTWEDWRNEIKCSADISANLVGSAALESLRELLTKISRVKIKDEKYGLGDISELTKVNSKTRSCW